MINFFDTNALLNLNFEDNIFNDKFLISSETLKELENIKVSSNKTDELKFLARQVVRFLENNEDLYKIIIVNKHHYELLDSYHLPVTNDNLIISCAYDYNINIEKVTFISFDLLCKSIAKNIFGLNVENHSKEDKEVYLGYREIILDDENMADFYSNINVNKFECLINEYVIIKNSDNEAVDKLRWNGTSYARLYNKPIRSQMFGDKIKPKDDYQAMVIDSIMTNTVTAISGKQGSGKSLLSLVCALNLIENGKYDNLVILFNPLKTRGTADLGFYKGSMIEKAMQNSIGQMLTSKFGDRYGVDLLISQGKLKLVSMADIRGMEIRENEILYITECQNTSSDILKLCLGRVSDGAKVIIEGDYTSQVDNNSFAGNNNGLKRAIDVLSGDELFGYVNLKNIWRSKIAELVEKF